MRKQQTRTIKCLHCGYGHRLSAQIISDVSETDVVRGPADSLRSIAAQLKSFVSGPDMDELNAWMAIKCVNCKQLFEHNVKTGATRI